MLDEMSVAEKFAWRLETACEQFETLQRLLRRELEIVGADRFASLRARGCTTQALAQSFIANVARSRRLLERGRDQINVPRDQRKAYLARTAIVVDVRDVQEHGYEADQQPSIPTLHHHVEQSASCDETGLFSDGTVILMGPINLVDLYVVVDAMRKAAGWLSLPSKDPAGIPDSEERS